MADDYLTLMEFVPGTKAKAQEVNANFSAVKYAIESKAAINGDSNQVFKVAVATEDAHAVTKAQLDDSSDYLMAEIKKRETRFCVKTGNTASGKGDLFSYEVLKITPKIGGTYKNLVISDYAGVQTTISSASAFSMTGQADGVYNIYIKPDGTFYTSANTIYKQPLRPTLVDGDVWFNTSVEPFSAIKYSENSDKEFLDMPLGKVTIKSAAITALETFPFNQNGYDVNMNSSLRVNTTLMASVINSVMPNYAKPISKAWGTTQTADTNGFVLISGWSNSSSTTFTLNGTTYSLFGGTGASYSGNAIFPVSASDTYCALGGGGGSTVTFFPLKGVN